MNPAFDPILLEIYWNRLVSIAEEQAKTLVRASFSTVVGEMEDLACGIYDLRGNLIAQAATGTQGILTGMSVGMKHMLREYPIESLAPGDVICCNDPWMITGHKYDIAVATPIFLLDTPVAIASTVLHSSDIGGISTAADSRSVYEEGLAIPIMKLFKKGERNEDLFKIIEANVRIPDQVIGDLLAQVAANAVSGQKVLDFMAEYELSSLTPLAQAIIIASEQAVKKAIGELPDGVYSHDTYADGIDEPLRIAATVTVRGTDLTVDFAGSSPQTKRGGINSVWNFTFAYTAQAVKCVLVPDIPNNDGLFRSFKMVAPEGSVVNPKRPAPVMARYIMVGAISSAVFGALAKAAPERAVAESSRITMIPFTGTDEKGDPFIQWLAGSGGAGARPTLDGYSATCYPANIKTVPAEILESGSPLFVLKKELITDSGGPGKYRGGCDQRATVTIRDGAQALVHCFFEGTKFAPLGYHGGMNGTCAEVKIDGRAVTPKEKYPLTPGSEFAYSFGGGGGYYDSTERDPELVLDDVINGYVSAESAARYYKVIVDPNSRTINWEETRRLRARGIPH